MITERNARLGFGVIAAMVGVGLVLQLILVIGKDDALFATVGGRIWTYFSFFTVLSNIGVAVTAGLLAVELHRQSLRFRVLRLAALVGITVTGVVFHLALADLQELTGWDLLADTILHTLSPLLSVLAWLVLGPRGMVDRRVAALSAVPAVAWLAYALMRGAVVEDRFGNDYYAYPFMNVELHGYALALLRCALVAVLFLALAAGAARADRHLPGVRTGPPA